MKNITKFLLGDKFMPEMYQGYLDLHIVLVGHSQKAKGHKNSKKQEILEIFIEIK